MAHSWHYPRWRRALMQISMWLLLGGTVSLAAWVSRDRNHNRLAPLTQLVQFDSLQLNLPASWRVAPGAHEGGMLVAVSPPGDDDATRFTARVQNLDDDRSPGDYLLGPDGVLREQLPGDGTDPGLSAIRVGGTAGVLVKITAVEQIGPMQVTAVDRWFACGIFPGKVRRAVVLEWEVPRDPSGPEAPLDQDEHAELLRAIAATVRPTLPPPAGQADAPV